MPDDKRHEEIMDVLQTMLKVQALYAVRDLPTKREKILFLNEGGLSHAEVAMIVGASPGSIRQTVYDAKKKANKS
ncbi:MAG: sigma factor-like helix-turn-helix DNA-binding protein [Pseudomonadota bacterium]